MDDAAWVTMTSKATAGVDFERVPKAFRSVTIASYSLCGTNIH